MRHEVELPRNLHAPRLARQMLVDWYGHEASQTELDESRLLVSELVTNAVVHGLGRIILRTDMDDDRLLIEVMDQGSGFELAVRRAPFEALRGRGLTIVDGLASRWGIHEGTTHVWAEIERRGPRLGEQKKPPTSDSPGGAGPRFRRRHQ